MREKARASETHTQTQRERETAEGTVRGLVMVMVMVLGMVLGMGGGHVIKEKGPTVARLRALTIFPYSGWLPSPIEPPMV